MQKRLLIFVCLFWTFPVFGQFIVPSLDQARPVSLASAAAWRVGSTIGVQAEVDYHEGDESNDASTESSYNAVTLAYQPGNIITELNYSSRRIMKSLDFDELTITNEDVDVSTLSLKLAIRGNRRVSIGLAYYRSEQEDATNDYSRTIYEGSFSIRLMDGLLYAGGGLQRYTDEGDDDSLKYNTLIGGVAMQIGDPLDMMFQVEASLRQTPETKSKDDNFIRYKSTESQLNVEFLAGSYFLSYQYFHQFDEREPDYKDLTTIRNRFGVGIKLGNLSIGLYRKSWEWKREDDKLNADSYQLTCGYNFI